MSESAFKAWLLDVYAPPPDRAQAESEPGEALLVWLLNENGERQMVSARLPVTFYAAGPAARLRQAWQFLQGCPGPPSLGRTERRELFSSQPLTVLSIGCPGYSAQSGLFRRLQPLFPDLDYYDADISPALRAAAAWGVFPLAHCAVALDPAGELQRITPLDTPWELDPPPAPLRILELEPDVDPSHAEPTALKVTFERFHYRFPLNPARPLLANLCALLRRHDPDVLLTSWGDTWLLPRLLEMAEQAGLEGAQALPLNRQPRAGPSYRKERSYFSYGQIVFKGQQVQLFGRWHIDRRNALLYGDLGLTGVFEFARVTSLPIQDAARLSPGTGISTMQILTALRQGILVPWRKQESETFRPASEMFARDQGGLVYQPTPGLHTHVAGIDFVSMYPSLMVRFNISPETAGSLPADPENLGRFGGVPESGTPDQGEPPGLVPQTLAPLLEKRIALKTRLGQMQRWDERRPADQARAMAHKWLLVTCFGYLGYKNARFGRIEAHEAVTAYGREALMRAKEAAEDLGCSVLHMYVDGLWIQRPGWQTPADFQVVLNEVAGRTGLSISLEGIYRWVIFLSSTQDSRVPVANRYFGVFQDGSLKVRGIEARRRDTPEWIAETQMAMLEQLALAPDARSLPAYLPQTLPILRRALDDLAQNRVPLEKLVVKQRLSRALEAYRSQSPAAAAARQLQAAGKQPKPGQSARFLYTCGEPGILAWDLPGAPDPRTVNKARYRQLMLRAAHTILLPLGVGRLGLNGLPAPQQQAFSRLALPIQGGVSALS